MGVNCFDSNFNKLPYSLCSQGDKTAFSNLALSHSISGEKNAPALNGNQLLGTISAR